MNLEILLKAADFVDRQPYRGKCCMFLYCLNVYSD